MILRKRFDYESIPFEKSTFFPFFPLKATNGNNINSQLLKNFQAINFRNSLVKFGIPEISDRKSKDFPTGCIHFSIFNIISMF